MSFRNGYLGAMILLVAVVATILGSWVLSLDVTENEVTNYNYVSELTGLFETEQAPAYIEYNPSTNYTGYYTDPDTKYWSGVTYTTAEQRNQYRLNLAPISEQTGVSVDLSSVTPAATDWFFLYWTENETVQEDTGVKHISLADLIATMGWTGYDEIVLVSDSNDYTSGGFVTFVTGAMLRDGNSDYDASVFMKDPSLTGTLTHRISGVPAAFWPRYTAESIDDPILAMSYEADTGYAMVYSDIAMESALGMYSPTDIYLLWGTGSAFLGSTMTLTEADYPDAQYLDIRQGVKVNA